jgi:uncharacterized repeat protein (TIGR01451 family)
VTAADNSVTGYTWTIGGSPTHNGAAGVISSFMYVDNSNPIVVDNGQATPSSYSHSTPDLGVLATNTMLVGTFAALSSGTWTPPAGMTELLDWASESVPSSVGMSIEINTEQRASPGYTGTRTATMSNPPAADAGATHILALRPLQADPKIAMTLNSNLVVGSSSSYTLTIGNNGPMSISAANITVTDTLPTGLTYVSKSGAGWSCSAVAQVVTCTYSGAALASGGSLPALTLNVNVVSGTVWTNTATVSSGADGDNDLTNSTATYTWPANTTTIATGSDPAAATIGPSALATDVDQFTLKTNTGTEPISSVTVNLSSSLGVDTLSITDSSNNVLGSVATPSSGSVTIPVIGMTATTTLQTFKVRVTPFVHVSMPAPPGGTYTITAPVTSWSGPAAHSGSDTNSNALTIDNLSPNGATTVLAVLGSQKYTLYWTTSSSSDFATTSGSVVYRWVGTTAGSEVPIEGSSPLKGDVNGTATVACVVTAAASTAVTRVDGSGGSSECTTSALVSGQEYTYVVFEKDSRGNYDTGTILSKPSLSIADASITEGDSGTKNLSFTVTLSAAIPANATATYTLTNGTATGGGSCSGTTDFVSTGGTVTVSAGSTTGTINVPICGDKTYEQDETFNVTLSNPTNATLGAPSIATGTILNDDVDPNGCFIDAFTGSDNSAPSANWTTTTSSGTFGTPKIYNNRLRMTDASTNVSTAAHLQRQFPGAGNKIVVEFDHFAYNGTGADGIALTFSDASVTPQAGAFGGSLGYAQKSNPGSDCTVAGGCSGFAGGWLGIGFDEFGNYANNTEGRIGGVGSRPDAVSVRGSGSGQTGYNYHTTSGTLTPGVDQPGTSAGPNHHYRITIDHTDSVHAYVTVERSTDGGTSYTTIVSPYDAKAQAGQAAVPTNWLLSYTGSTGASTNIHEIDNLKVCAVKPIVSLIAVDHYELSLPTNGVACVAAPVTVTACADNVSPCTNKTTTIQGTTATLATTAGTLGSTTVTFNATGIATTSLSYTNAADGAAATVTLSAEQTTATNSRKCCPNGASCTVSNSCGITFNTTGFIFSSAADGSAATIPNQVAGTESATYYLRAVKTSSTTKACEAALSGTSSVNLAFQCVDPTTCSSVAGPSCGAGNGYFCLTPYSDTTAQTPVPIVGNPQTGVTSYSAVNLVFDSNGNAPFTFNYKDVGQIALFASKPASGTLLTNLVGATNTFVVKPYALVLSGIKCTTATAASCGAGALAMSTSGDNPAAANAAGVTFIRAGDPFTVTVTAQANGGTATPNFGKESSPEWIRLTPVAFAGLSNNPSVDRSLTGDMAVGSSSLTALSSTAGYAVGDRIRVAGASTAGTDLITTVSAIASATQLTLSAPAVTAVTGAVVNYMFPSFSGGSATGTNFTWGEVGIITLTPSIGDSSYLGSGSVTGTTSGNVGRFYPHHFEVTGSVISRSDLQTTEAQTTPYTYMGEPQKVTLTVTAHNAADGATQNYAGSFAKLDATTLGTGANWFNTGCAVGTQCMGLGAMNPGASSGTGLSGRLSVSTGPGNPSSSWASGVGTFSAHIVLSRNSTPDGPYGTLKFGAAPQDSDGVVLPSPSSSDTHKMDFDATEGNTLASNPDSTNERRLLFTTKGYFGRLWLGNAYGSDQKSLSVPYETQYWNGFVFVRNTADSLVPFALGNVSLNTVLGTPPTLTLGSFASGSGTLGLSAPGVPGTVDVYVNLGSTGSQANCPGYAVGTSAGRTYLSGKWCDSNYDRDPVSRATFGVQAGKRGPIYIRENY